MNEQILILLFLIIAFTVTIIMYMWEAKKSIEYKNDERWKLILLKSKKIADLSNWLLLIALAILSTMDVFSNLNVMISLTRLTLIGEIFVGLHNTLELFSAVFYDHKI